MKDNPTMSKAEVDERIRALIEPFNKKGVDIAPETPPQLAAICMRALQRAINDRYHPFRWD